MMCCCLIVTGVSTYLLYRAALSEETARMRDIARTNALLLNEIARFNEVYPSDYPGGPLETALAQVREAHRGFPGMGESGEFTIGRRERDSIVYLLADRHPGEDLPGPIPFDSKLGEPMRRALSGLSGTVIGIDYHGNTVLAAYESLPKLGLGVVAKIDIAEIRAPFIRAGLIAGLVTVLVVVIGALLFLRIADAAMRALRDSAQQLDTVVNTTHILLAYMDPRFNFIWVNKAYAEADGKDPSYFPGKNHFDLYPYGENETIFADVVRTGKPFYAYARAFEYAEHPERGVSYWDWSVVPTKDGQGGITGLLFSLANVTDRIQMQDFLKASEEKYRLLVETVNSVILVGQDGVIRFVNDRVKALLGYSPEELIGKEVGFFLDDREKERAQEHHRLWTAGKTIDSSTMYRIQHKDGDVRYVQVTGTLMIWEGRPAVLTFMTDITKRTRAEDALRVSEEKYRQLVENVGSVIVVIQDGVFKFVSDRIKDQLGYSPEELLGNEATFFLAEGEKEKTRARYRALVSGQQTPLTTFRARHKNGDIRHFEGNGTPSNWEGRPAVLSFMMDITDRVRAEEAMRESERRYLSLFENMLDGFAYQQMIFDDRGNPVDYIFLETNDAFERLTGLKDVVGKRVTEVIPRMRQEGRELLKTFGRAAQTGVPEEFEIEFAPLNRWFSVSVYSPKKGYFATIFENITERKRSEQALKEAHANLRLALKAGSAGTWDWDIANNTFTWSDEFREIFGMDPNATAGFEAWAEAVHPEDREEASKKIQDAIDKKEDLTNDYRIVLPSGEIRWIRAVGRALYAENIPLRMVGLCIDITERKRAETIIHARERLFEYAASHSLEELLPRVLDEVGELTNSPIGFYHFVDKDQNSLSLQAWSTKTVNEFCTAEGKGQHYPIDQAGVWVDCVRQRRPVIHNDYGSLPHKKGLPRGHAPVIRELIVPIMRSERIVAILGVGNKTTDYTEKDVQMVSYVADVAWEITESKLAEVALRESEHRYHSLFENMLEGFAYCRMVYDDQDTPLDFICLDVNDAFERQTGLKDVVGRRVSEVIPGVREAASEMFDTYGRVALTGKPEELEIDFTPTGQWFHVFVYSVEKGYFVVVFDNITERKRAEQLIAQSLAEKESLLREIHHRVKNNLQIVSSLLSMAGMGTKNREAVDLLHDAESRVHAMALIHSQLYGTQRLDQIDVKKNIRDLTDRLSTIYSAPGKKIVHTVGGQDVFLTIHQAIPAALAINEVVINAYKYAFAGRSAGAIRISVAHADDTITIAITDDGIGLPAGFDVENTDTLGLRLVKNLIEGQLAGRVNFVSRKGTKVTMRFRKDGHEGVHSGTSGR